jgi:hypothetical protein
MRRTLTELPSEECQEHQEEQEGWRELMGTDEHFDERILRRESECEVQPATSRSRRQ